MDSEIQKSLKALQKGDTILYPTDTVWGIGCDATSEKAVSKIFELKKRNESKSLVILVDGLQMLKTFVRSVPDNVLQLLNSSKRPTTIIYNNPRGLAKNSIANDNTVAIRIAKHDFCQQLIAEFGKPIVSTSANISGRPTPKSFQEIDKSILDAVDYVVNLHQESENSKPSRIIKISENGTLQIIRE